MAGRQHSAWPIYVRELEVREAFDVTPLMRRVVLTGDQLGAFEANGHQVEPFRTENADDHVKLVILDPADPDIAPPAQDDGHLDWTPESLGRARDYTPRRYDPEARRLELDFVRHDGGLAAEWAQRVRPGERIHVAGPRGTTVLPPGIDWYFLVGDETALPAIARRIEELPAGTPVTAVVSVPTASEEQRFDHQTDLHLTWVHRDTAGPDALMDAVTSAPWHQGQVYAWAAGEAGMLRPLRRWFKQERQVAAGYTDIAGYWRAGQSQKEMAQALHRLRHSASLAVPYALRAAFTLDLPELLAEGHDRVDRLAEGAGAQPRGVAKVLRVLAHEGYVTLGADGAVALTPQGSVLLEERPRAMLDHRNGHARLDDAWPGLVHAVRTGESGFTAARGHSFWEELAGDDRLGRTFDQGLANWSGDWAAEVVAALDLADRHLVDVGGGTGTLLAAALSAHPTARGTLVELPTTAARARAALDEAGLLDRATLAEQSFFAPLPKDGDLYLLAQVLHDWPDAEVVAILRGVAEAAGDRPVYLVERLASASDDHHDVDFDLQMYAVFGSGERDRDEFAALAARAGLELVEARPLRDTLHLVELRAAR
ncbi:siderophore-interacting protein [Streptomyces sp. NPDC005438]|uniref:siderophore-interacting protein n=1 Tax=Streptomyces sp. NPDC005438 TaxID=3156880 RepID=UPI0033B8D4B9